MACGGSRSGARRRDACPPSEDRLRSSGPGDALGEVGFRRTTGDPIIGTGGDLFRGVEDLIGSDSLTDFGAFDIGGSLGPDLENEATVDVH